ncbi:MAG: EAL domain-containing protein [Acetobacteraceae bacterium]|nr:EAL domain-containing protein [Acetobacteraceae bacterium]
MPPAPLPPNETERLAALNALGLLDTPTEEVFDSLVRLASTVLDAPIAAVSLVDKERQWFKSVIGLPEGVRETPRDCSFCSHAILAPHETLSVPDATLDGRFSDNPLVTGDPGVRFYAGVPLVDPEGFALGALCVVDVTPRTPTPRQMAKLRDIATGVSAALRLHRALRDLDNQAHRDPLTGLGNRRGFDRQLAIPAQSTQALLLLDMDSFKVINDTFGHPAGDAALREVAQRLLTAVRESDQAFRLGGDEFALLLPELGDHDGVRAVADRLHAVLGQPFVLDGLVMDLGVSIGAAILPADTADLRTLVPRADAALYRAKRAGRGLTRIAGESGDGSDSDLSTSASASRHSLKTRLKQALVPPGAEPFDLVFQPIVSLSNPGLPTNEALIRWSPELGDSVPPGQFVPMAEHSGLAPHLDRWVLRTACAMATKWSKPWGVSVNISAITLGSVDLASMVHDILDQTGLDAGRLTVELTETALADDPARAGRQAEALRSLGVGIALDDFGAGHSSLVALRNYPFTKLKIDRALISGIDRDPVRCHSVRFAAELGRMLDLTVAAEGVERPEELRVLRECGVGECQGYLLARPVAHAAIDGAVEDAVRLALIERPADMQARRANPAPGPADASATTQLSDCEIAPLSLRRAGARDRRRVGRGA